MTRPVKSFAPADPPADDASGELAVLDLKHAKVGRHMNWWRGYSIFISVFVGLVSYALWFASRVTRGTARPSSFSTLAGEGAALSLADGSTVVLVAGSILTLPEKLVGAWPRAVRLQGQAMFVPSHQATGPKGVAPFTVGTRQAVVTATGTVFTVRCFAEDSATVVTVHQGEVEVRGFGGGNKLTVHAGERAVVRINTATLEPPTAEAGASAPRVP